MEFSEIHPYVRFSRTLTLKPDTVFPTFVPYDARVFYAFSGTGEIVCENKTVTLCRSDMLIINTGVPYHLLPPKTGEVQYLALNFDFTYENHEKTVPIQPDPPEEFRPQEILSPVLFSDCPKLNRALYVPNMVEAEALLLEIETLYQQKMRYFAPRISAKCMELLTQAVIHSGMAGAKAQKAGESAASIVQYIHAHYHEPLDNAAIGRAFHFHPNYINRLMIAHTGMSLHQYLLHTRIAYAIRYLDGSSLSVSEISEAVGFKGPSHFSRYFRQVTGQSPRNYRRPPK